ncbi:unnamed protein product [Scytosiphon promiscuus]
MLSSSFASRAVRLTPHQLAKASNAMFTTASPCSQLRTPLPGAYRESTELWHNGKPAEDSANVEQWVWNNRQFRPVSPPPAPKTMKNEAELTELLASTDPDSLVVVKFHAILCGASKAIEGKFKQTAAEFADLHLNGQQSVAFADVCFDSNRQLCEKMGIQSVPHVQIFSGSHGKIADFSIAPTQYDTLTSLLTERRESVRARKQL